MANPFKIKPLVKGSYTNLRKTENANELLNHVQNILSAEVRVGVGPSAVHASKEKITIHISIDDIKRQLGL